MSKKELKLEVGKTYKDRNGNIYKVFAEIPKESRYHRQGFRFIAACVFDGTHFYYAADGTNELAWPELKLVKEVKPTRRLKGWINIYHDGGTGATYPTKKEADENANSNRIACVEIDIEYEEGQGL